MYCGQCGEPATLGANFCQECGAKLSNKTNSEMEQSGSKKPVEGETNLAHSKNESNQSQLPIDQSSKFLGGIYHPWRRLFARTVDTLLLGSIILIIASYLFGYLFPQYIDGYVKVLANPLSAVIILYLLWIPIEAAFLASIGTTPAKWIFGIGVLCSNGEKLSYSNALKRAFLV